jgi:hypothetical protein
MSLLFGEAGLVTRRIEDRHGAEEPGHEPEDVETLDGATADQPTDGGEGGHDAGTA